MNRPKSAQFGVGQVVLHKLFNYRGVIYDVDPVFMLSDEWYRQMAKSNPPRDEPWYRVLVDNATHETYVAERNLEPDADPEDPVRHPLLDAYFSGFEDDHYLPRDRGN